MLDHEKQELVVRVERACGTPFGRGGDTAELAVVRTGAPAQPGLLRESPARSGKGMTRPNGGGGFVPGPGSFRPSATRGTMVGDSSTATPSTTATRPSAIHQRRTGTMASTNASTATVRPRNPCARTATGCCTQEASTATASQAARCQATGCAAPGTGPAPSATPSTHSG